MKNLNQKLKNNRHHLRLVKTLEQKPTPQPKNLMEIILLVIDGYIANPLSFITDLLGVSLLFLIVFLGFMVILFLAQE